VQAAVDAMSPSLKIYFEDFGDARLAIGFSGGNSCFEKDSSIG
jgi:hypothetical protein